MYENNPFVPSTSTNDIDLAQFEDAYTHAPATDTIPDGKYQVSVERVELTRAKRTGNPMLLWRLKILNSEYAGRIMFRQNMLMTPENIKWLKHDLVLCGLILGKLSELPLKLEQLLGIKLEISKVTKNEIENVYFNARILTANEPGGQTQNGSDLPF